MYWYEYGVLFGTHTAVTDHLSGGDISVVTYVAAGTLSCVLGISPTARWYASRYRPLYSVVYCCEACHRPIM